MLFQLVFAYIYISQRSVETHLPCRGIYNNHIIANCLQSVPVKKFQKWSITGEDMNKCKVPRFLATVYISDTAALWVIDETGSRHIPTEAKNYPQNSDRQLQISDRRCRFWIVKIGIWRLNKFPQNAGLSASFFGIFGRKFFAP